MATPKGYFGSNMGIDKPDTLPEYPKPITFTETYDKGIGSGGLAFAKFVLAVIIVIIWIFKDGI